MRQAVARQKWLYGGSGGKVSDYENEDLPGSIKAALRLADSWLGAPSAISKELIDDVRAHLNQEQIIDLIMELWKNSRNKMYVAFGMGPAINSEHLAYVEFDQSTEKILTVGEPGIRAV